MSFSFESTRVQKPLIQPTTDNAGSTYRFAHRRQNLDGQHSLWTEGPTTDLPATFTPESYGDSYLKDEFVMSDDNGVTWRIITTAANHTGALLVTAFSTGWAVTTDSNNQQSFINSATLGTFSATENPSRDFYLVNNGPSVSILGFNVIDTVTELVASQYSGQVQLALNGTFFSAGNGNPTTSFDQSLIWQTPPQSLNAFRVSLPTNAFLRFTLTLVNFPQGGIQSSSVDFGLEFVANPTQFPIGLDHVWLKGSRLIDAQAGFNANLISTSAANTLNIAPFAVNIDGSAYYQASNLTLIRTPSGTVNYRLQATSENQTQIVESSTALPSNAVNLATFDFDGTTVSSIIYVAPIRTIDYNKLTDATIARGRFISINSSGEPVLATSAAEVIGVSLFTDSGYYARSGLVWLESSAAITLGSFVSPNGSGLAQAASTGPGVALSAATAANQFILVDFNAASGGSSGGGGGSAIEVEDEGISLTTNVTKFNFAGAGVTVTEPATDEVLVTIPGGSGGGSSIPDPDYLLLLNLNGADASTTIVDSSPYARAVTVNGSNSELDTSDPKFGTAALQSITGGNSTTDYLSVLIPEFQVNGNWTISAWIKWNSLNGSVSEPFIAGKRDGGGSNISFTFTYLAGDFLFIWTTNGSSFGTTVTRTFAPTLGVYHFVSLTKSGNNIYIHVDGVQIGATATLSSAIHENILPLSILADTANAINTDLLIDDYQLVQKALYTTPSYIPPIAEATVPLLTDTLGNLADVDVSGVLVDVQALVYNATNSQWEPQQTIVAETPLGTETFVEFTGLSGTNSWYEILMNFELTTDDNVQVFFNGDTTESNYNSTAHYVSNNGSVTGDGNNDRSIGPFCYGATGGGPAHAVMQVHRMADCAHFFYQGMYIDSTATDAAAIQSGSGLRGPNTAEITSIRIQARSGTFNAGSSFRLTKRF